MKTKHSAVVISVIFEFVSDASVPEQVLIDQISSMSLAEIATNKTFFMSEYVLAFSDAKNLKKQAP